MIPKQRDTEGGEARTDTLRFLRALRCSAFAQFAAPTLGSTTPLNADVVSTIARNARSIDLV